jgi:hypothetical protein
MDESMTLVERLETEKHSGFVKKPRYYANGDFLTYFDSPNHCHRQRISDVLTVYFDSQSGALVGLKVKGVRLLLEKAKAYNICVTDGKKTLGMLLVSLAAVAQEEEQQEALKLAEAYGQLELPVEEIAFSAA